MHAYFFLLTSAAALVASIPHPVPDASPDLPSGPPPPMMTSFLMAPDSCVGPELSEQCAKDIEVQNQWQIAIAGGGIYIDPRGGCSAEYQKQIWTAAEDTQGLARNASTILADDKNPNQEHGAKYYIGNDWREYNDRLVHNFDNVARGRMGRRLHQFVIVRCDDWWTKCDKKVKGNPGMPVGAYAINYDGWFKHRYSYVNFCPVFFDGNIDQLGRRITDLKTDVAQKRYDRIEDANWLFTKAQVLLHEMMHLKGHTDPEPHIIDEVIAPGANGERLAYKPWYIYKLARRSKQNDGSSGGGTRSTTNADSYAVLASSLYAQAATGGDHWPGHGPDPKGPKQSQSPATAVIINVDVPANNSPNFKTFSTDQAFEDQLSKHEAEDTTDDNGNDAWQPSDINGDPNRDYHGTR